MKIFTISMLKILRSLWRAAVSKNNFSLKLIIWLFRVSSKCSVFVFFLCRDDEKLENKFEAWQLLSKIERIFFPKSGPFQASFYLLLSFQYSWYTVNKWSMTGFETQSFGFGSNHCTNWATTTAKNWKKVWNRAFTSLTSRRNRLLSVHSWWTDRCIQAMLLHVGVCRAREHSLTL